MNDLVKFGAGGLPATAEDLKTGLAHVSAGLQGSIGGIPILRLQKDGVFAYGQEMIEPQEGSQWAVNPHSIMHGFACWSKNDDPGVANELLGEAMVPLTSPPPQQGELQDYGFPWKSQISMQLQCLNGEDTGVTVLYKSTAVGFMNMAKGLIDQIVLQLQHDPNAYVPVVALEAGHYQHKQWGKTYFPELTIQRWISIEGEAAQMTEGEKAGHEGDEPEAEAPAEKPATKPSARRGRRAAIADANTTDADEAADETEAPGDDTSADNAPPVRRRRRRAS